MPLFWENNRWFEQRRKRTDKSVQGFTEKKGNRHKAKKDTLEIEKDINNVKIWYSSFEFSNLLGDKEEL